MDSDKQLLTLPDFVERYSLSRTSAYREHLAGRLRFTKVARRSYIAAEDAQEWLDGLRRASQSQKSI